MAFEDIASELLAIIVDNIWPEDLLAFSLTCHRLSDVTRARLQEHRQLRSRLTQITLGSSNPGRDVDFLLQLSSGPWNILYPRALTLYSQTSKSLEEMVEATLLKSIREKEDPSSRLAVENFSQWPRFAHNGRKDGVHALCARTLPNLRTLEIVAVDADYLLSYICGLALPSTVPVGPPVCFKFLEKLTVDLSMAHFTGAATRLLAAFVHVPTLKSIEAIHIDLDDIDLLEFRLPKTSDLTHLVFRDSKIDVLSLGMLLTSMRNLKSFEYSYSRGRFGGNLLIPYDHFHARYVVFALTDHSTTTLETLVLDCTYNWYPNAKALVFSRLISTLSGFKCLKSVTLSADLFLHGLTSIFRQWSLLPRTLEELHIIRLSRSSQAMIRQLFLALPDLYKLRARTAWKIKVSVQPGRGQNGTTEIHDGLAPEDPILFTLHRPPHNLIESVYCSHCAKGEVKRIHTRSKIKRMIQTARNKTAG